MNQEKNNRSDPKTLEKRFGFITDPVLRANLGYTLFYILYLINQEFCEKDEKIKNALRKNILLHTASIVEACLYYYLKRLVEEGGVGEKKSFGHEWVVRERKEIYKANSEKRVMGVVEERVSIHLKADTKFNTLIRAAKKAGVLTEELNQKAHKIRDIRNRFHLTNLSGVEEDQYSKELVDQIFKDTRQILHHLEFEALMIIL